MRWMDLKGYRPPAEYLRRDEPEPEKKEEDFSLLDALSAGVGTAEEHFGALTGMENFANEGRAIKERNLHQYEDNSIPYHLQNILVALPESAGIMAASTAAGIPLGGALGAAGGFARGALTQVPRVSGLLWDLAKAYQGAGTASKIARAVIPQNAKIATSAELGAAMEAGIEGYEAERRFIDLAKRNGTYVQGQTEQQARDVRDNVFWDNMGIISAFNLPQYNALMGRPARGLLGNVGRTVASGFGEGTEEVAQELASAYELGVTPQWRDIRDSFIAGGVLGTGMHGAGTAARYGYDRLTGAPTAEEIEEALNARKERLKEYSDRIGGRTVDADGNARYNADSVYGKFRGNVQDALNRQGEYREETARQSYREAENEARLQQRLPALRNWADKHSGGQMSDAVFDSIVRNAQEIGVPVERALAQAVAESNGSQDVTSGAGAIGVMQLMPETAEGLGVDPYDTEQNIRGGIQYLKQQYDRFGDWNLAHAAYNAGAGNVEKAGNRVPAFYETQNYVAKINGFMNDSPPGSETRYAGEDGKGEGRYWVRQGDNVSFDGAQPDLLNAVDMLGEMFYKRTGKKLVVTAGTNGDHPSNGSEHGHDAGWKVDVADAGANGVGLDEDGALFTADYKAQPFLKEFIEFGRSLGLGMNLEAEGTPNVHIDVALDGTQWDGNGDNAGGFNRNNVSQSRAEEIFNERYDPNKYPVPQWQDRNKDEQTKPLFDLNAEDAQTQSLLAEFARARASDDRDKGFFKDMFNEAGEFQDTEANRAAIRERYGDDFSEWVNSRQETPTSPARTQSRAPRQGAPKKITNEDILAATDDFLGRLRTDRTNPNTLLELQEARRAGDVAKMESILRQNNVEITPVESTAPVAPSPQPPVQSENVVQNNQPPENILTSEQETAQPQQETKPATPKPTKEQKQTQTHINRVRQNVRDGVENRTKRQKQGESIIWLAEKNGIEIPDNEMHGLQIGAPNMVRRWRDNLLEAGVLNTQPAQQAPSQNNPPAQNAAPPVSEEQKKWNDIKHGYQERGEMMQKARTIGGLNNIQGRASAPTPETNTSTAPPQSTAETSELANPAVYKIRQEERAPQEKSNLRYSDDDSGVTPTDDPTGISAYGQAIEQREQRQVQNAKEAKQKEDRTIFEQEYFRQKQKEKLSQATEPEYEARTQNTADIVNAQRAQRVDTLLAMEGLTPDKTERRSQIEEALYSPAIGQETRKRKGETLAELLSLPQIKYHTNSGYNLNALKISLNHGNLKAIQQAQEILSNIELPEIELPVQREKSPPKTTARTPKTQASIEAEQRARKQKKAQSQYERQERARREAEQDEFETELQIEDESAEDRINYAEGLEDLFELEDQRQESLRQERQQPSEREKLDAERRADRRRRDVRDEQADEYALSAQEEDIDRRYQKSQRASENAQQGLMEGTAESVQRQRENEQARREWESEDLDDLFYLEEEIADLDRTEPEPREETREEKQENVTRREQPAQEDDRDVFDLLPESAELNDVESDESTTQSPPREIPQTAPQQAEPKPQQSKPDSKPAEKETDEQQAIEELKAKTKAELEEILEADKYPSIQEYLDDSFKYLNYKSLEAAQIGRDSALKDARKMKAENRVVKFATTRLRKNWVSKATETDSYDRTLDKKAQKIIGKMYDGEITDEEAYEKLDDLLSGRVQEKANAKKAERQEKRKQIIQKLKDDLAQILDLDNHPSLKEYLHTAIDGRTQDNQSEVLKKLKEWCDKLIAQAKGIRDKGKIEEWEERAKERLPKLQPKPQSNTQKTTPARETPNPQEQEAKQEPVTEKKKGTQSEREPIADEIIYSVHTATGRTGYRRIDYYSNNDVISKSDAEKHIRHGLAVQLKDVTDEIIHHIALQRILQKWLDKQLRRDEYADVGYNLDALLKKHPLGRQIQSIREQYGNKELTAQEAYKKMAELLGVKKQADHILPDNVKKFLESNKGKADITGAPDIDTSNVVAEKDLTPAQKLLVSFGKKLGVRVMFFDNPDGRFRGVHKEGYSLLNINGNKGLGGVFWHESFHWLKNNNPELYKALVKAAGITDAQRRAYLETSKRTDLQSNEAIDEEILADMMDDVAKRTGLFQSIAGKNRGLIERAIQWFKDTLNKFIDHFRNPQGKLTTAQAQALANEFGRIANQLKDPNGNQIFRYNRRTHNVELANNREWSNAAIEEMTKKSAHHATKYFAAGKKAITDEEYLQAVDDFKNATTDEQRRSAFKKLQDMVRLTAEEAGFTNAIPEQTVAYKTRTGAAPKKTIKVYKVFTVADDGSPTALFIGGTEKLPQGVWLDAQDAYHFKAKNGKYYVPSTQNPFTKGGKTGVAVEIPDGATRQELIKRGFLPKGSKATKVTALAYRPGWHAGTLPFFPQGGVKPKNGMTSAYPNIHRYNQVVFECELAADKDFTAEAEAQPKARTKDGKLNTREADLQYMPKNGFYYYATNPLTHGHPELGMWAISGSLKINRALTQEECDKILADNNMAPQEWEQGKMNLADLGYTGVQSDAARKTLAPITYDDNGNVIPLSQRFDAKKDDVRYSIGADDNSTKSFKQRLKNLLGVEGKNIPIHKQMKRQLEDLSDMKIAADHLPEGVQVKIDKIAKVIRTGREYDWANILPEVGNAVAEQLGITQSAEMGNYIGKFILNGAPNDESAEAKEFAKAMRENTEMYNKVMAIRNTFNEWNNMSAEEQMIASTRYDKEIPPLRERAQKFWQYLRTELFDTQMPIHYHVAKFVKATGVKLSESINPEIAFRNLRGMQQRAMRMVYGNELTREALQKMYPNVDFSNWKPIAMILESIKAEPGSQRYILFDQFVKACHFLDIHRHNDNVLMQQSKIRGEIRDLRAELDKADTKKKKAELTRSIRKKEESLEALEQKIMDTPDAYTYDKCADLVSKYSDEFGEAQKALVRYSRALLDIWVDSGMMDRRRYHQLLEAYPNYVPLHREFDENPNLNTVDSMKHMLGSTKDVKDAIAAISNNTFDYIQRTEKNKAKLLLANLANFDGVGGIFELVDGSSPNDGTIIHFYENGKRKALQCSDEDIVKAVNTMNQPTMNLFLKVLQVPALMLRATATGLSPGFIAGNFLRDPQDAFMVSKRYGAKSIKDLPMDFITNPFITWKYVADAVHMSPLFEEYAVSGAAQSDFFSFDRDYKAEAIERLTKKNYKRFASPKGVIELLGKLGEWSELTTRLRIYDKVKKSRAKEHGGINIYDDLVTAAFESRDFIDFARHGNAGRTWNTLTAFANPVLQGFDKQWRTYDLGQLKVFGGTEETQKNFRISVARLFLGGILPALVLSLLHKNEDWYKDDVQDWEKENYWILNESLRVSKGADLGLRFFSNLTEHLIASDPVRADKVLQPLKGILPDLMPTAFLPIFECMANYDLFRRQPIVPQREVNKFKDTPELQYDSTNSKLAVLLGRVTGVSPRYIDHVIYGYTSGFGKEATHLIDTVTPGRHTAWTRSDVPFFSRILRTPYRAPKIVSEYYEEFGRQESYAQRLAWEKKHGNPNAKPSTEYDPALHRRLKNIQRAMQNLNAAERAIMDDPKLTSEQVEEKREEIQKRRVELCRKAFQRAR